MANKQNHKGGVFNKVKDAARSVALATALTTGSAATSEYAYADAPENGATPALNMVNDAYQDYKDAMQDNNLPESFLYKYDDTTKQGVVGVKRDAENDAWLAYTKVTGYNGKSKTPAPHQLVIVSPEAEDVEILGITDKHCLDLTRKFMNNTGLKIDASGLDKNNSAIAFIDEKMMGEMVNGKFKPHNFVKGVNTSVISKDEEDRQKPLQVSSKDNSVKLVDLNSVDFNLEKLEEKYAEEVVFPNAGRPLFDKVPVEFKNPSESFDKIRNPRPLQYDADNDVWMVEAKGKGYEHVMDGVKDPRLMPPIIQHKLLVVPTDLEKIEILSKDDPKAIEYNKNMMEENPKLVINDKGVSPMESMVYANEKLVGTKTVDKRTKKEIITPFGFTQKDHLSVISNHYDERSTPLEIKVGANPVKRMDLLDKEVYYNLEDAPTVTPGGRTGFATTSQQETFVILHGDGHHKARLNSNQAYQTTYLGIAEVLQEGILKYDAPANYVGTSVVTGGNGNGTFVVHNVMSDITPTKEEMESYSYYEKPDVGSNSSTHASRSRPSMAVSSGSYSSRKPSWSKDLGELDIEFNRDLAATVMLGSGHTPQSIEYPVKELGASPNPAADPAVQSILLYRTITSPDGRLGDLTRVLQQVNKGSYTMGRFADNHINERLQREVSPVVSTVANKMLDTFIGPSGRGL